MDLKLDNKTALVTGSTGGIGLAIAKGLAAEGARVYINGRTEARVLQAMELIRREHPNARLEGLAADLATVEGVETATVRIVELDILVNNLGVYAVKAFEEITDQDWLAMIETNFLSGVRLSRHWLPRMKAAGWGRIIFVSSESAVQIPKEMIHYGVTKTMQVSLARGLAETTAGTAVTVNSILPGPTLSEGLADFVEGAAKQQGVTADQVEKDFFRSVRPSSLLRRFESTDEVAAAAVFLASPLSSGTNGAALRVEGGVVRGIL
ncbi:MAG: SDR family NAD(P)-dependent oxidoreductase [Acidobacteriota bacterium]|nr:SDR family NAD(P)-dependent oxidoreductase [Acidobacteriota bacterium]